MIRKRSWGLTIAALSGVVALMIVSPVIGGSGRTFVEKQRSYTVGSAAEAYTVLRQAGVGGRLMVLLDERANIVPRVYDRGFEWSLSDTRYEPPFQPLNVTGGLIETGVARQVYFVPPPSARAAVKQRYAGRWDSVDDVHGVDRRFYGAPVHVLFNDLDPAVLREKVVVYARRDVLDKYDPAFLKRVMSPDVADVVVIVGAP